MGLKNIPRFIPPLSSAELISAMTSKGKREDSQKALRTFAKTFAEFIGVKYAIPVPSARMGLTALLHSLDLPKNGEVIVPALTHYRMATVFLDFGLRPRFVDIHPDTYCIDSEKIKEAITPATVRILAVHLYGRACQMNVIKKIADRHSLIVIEDCAQAFGGYFDGCRLGSFGNGAVFSFHPHKNISTIGGGMAVTNSSELAQKLMSWGSKQPRIGMIVLPWRIFHAMAMNAVTEPWCWNHLIHPILKLSARRNIDPIELVTDETPEHKKIADWQVFRMPGEMQARIGLDQIAKLDHRNQRRIRNGNRLLDRLKNIEGVEIAAPAKEGENIYMSFVIRVKDRNSFRWRLLHLGVDTHPGNMFAGPRLPKLEGTGECSIALDAVKRMIHLPIYPQLKEEDVDTIADAVIASAVKNKPKLRS